MTHALCTKLLTAKPTSGLNKAGYITEKPT